MEIETKCKGAYEYTGDLNPRHARYWGIQMQGMEVEKVSDAALKLTVTRNT